VAGSVNTAGVGPSAEGFSWPISNPVVTTEFGERSPFQASHTGIDLASTLYSPVRAAADGIVIDSGLAVPGNSSASYGMRVSIAHKGGIATLYGHLDDEKYKPTVKAGDRVDRGQVIGYIGMTGLTTGPHVHFEVLVGGEPRNPRNYLPK
jgi:murein DD-endopeptidase MepM/ murein hydrolase activator NlpD